MAPSTKNIVILGKTGAGKSSIANTIFGEKDVFQTNHSPKSQTSVCKAETRSVNGRNITLIDTPGFFDTALSEEQLKSETVRCLLECAPGPHAFLIVLKVEKFTEHEIDVITQIKQHFSLEVLKYATVLFTHGDQLPEDMRIQNFVNQSEALKDLVNECGGRCHIIDNKYWNNEQEDTYRSNQFQLAELLNTIDKMVEDNRGSYLSNQMLQNGKAEIQNEKEIILRETSGNMSDAENTKQAKEKVYYRYLTNYADITARAMLCALFGPGSLTVINDKEDQTQCMAQAGSAVTSVASVVATGVAVARSLPVGVGIAAANAVAGAVVNNTRRGSKTCLLYMQSSEKTEQGGLD